MTEDFYDDKGKMDEDNWVEQEAKKAKDTIEKIKGHWFTKKEE